MKRKKIIPNHNRVPVIDVFIAELRAYLPSKDYQTTVTDEEQSKVLVRLKENSARGKFSFVLDGLTLNTKHCFGMEKWLGYADNTFTLKQYLESNHPAQGIAYWMYGSCVWDLVKVHKEVVNFYNATTVFNLALKHANGKYLLCRCEVTFFQISVEKLGTEFCYEFQILKDFDDEDFSLKFFDNSGYRDDFFDVINKLKKEKFKAVELFSEQEMRILYRYAHKEKITSENIAKAFKITERTVEKHNTNILDKAEMFFFKRFDSAKKFAAYLKKIDLI